MRSLQKRYLFLALALLVLAWLIQSEKGAHSHSYQFEPVRFPCSDVGCISGGSANAGRCQCGEIDLKLDLPCGGSHLCQCGFVACSCGKYCNDIKEPCTAAQECRPIDLKESSPGADLLSDSSW